MFFYLPALRVYVEKGDILTIAGGLALVIVIAVIMNPQYLEDIPVIPSTPKPTPEPTVILPVDPTPVTVVTTVPVIEPTAVPLRPDDSPYRIFYTNEPFTYPRFKMPDNIRIFGASDIMPRSEELVPFAYVEETRGGLTEVFSVPYPLWVINTTVTANRTPQYGNFQMALCYASNGSVIKGEEVLNRGRSYRIVQTSNTDLYMIVTTAYIDLYHMSFETPRSYYDMYRP